MKEEIAILFVCCLELAEVRSWEIPRWMFLRNRFELSLRFPVLRSVSFQLSLNNVGWKPTLRKLFRDAPLVDGFDTSALVVPPSGGN